MTPLPLGLLYTQDDALVRKLTGVLHALASLKHLRQSSEMAVACRQHDPVLVIMDLRAERSAGLLAWLRKDFPQTPLVALAAPRSDPALRAAMMGVFGVEDPDLDLRRIQDLVRNALSQLDLVRENRLLRARAQGPVAAPPAASPLGAGSGGAPARFDHLSRACRNLDNAEAVLDSIVEGVADYAKVSRVGIFSTLHGGNVYRLRAGIKCFDDTYKLDVPADGPIVQWMLLNAHPIARATLGHIEDSPERLLLTQFLDALGAEAVVPLHSRRRIMGWVFVGRRITGMHITEADLVDLTFMVEQASVILENTLLYEEIGLQKTLVETVLHSMPEGIVALGTDDKIQWYNRAAEEILGVPLRAALGQPPSVLGGRLAGMMVRCARGDADQQAGEWVDPRTRLSLAVETRVLTQGGERLGSMAILRDVTRERLLEEKQARLERARFWTDLAAAISHEVRNPLVAISTFAQLLPERYTDPEFRTHFSELATHEIQRLNAVVDQLSAFANPPDLAFKILDVTTVLRRAADAAMSLHPVKGVRVEPVFGKGLPRISGDEAALHDGFAHLITNALEAVEHVHRGVVRLSVEKRDGQDGPNGVHVVIQDNASGIPEAIRDRVFSPFCSSKARGIGLGLPIAKRTITDHNGSIQIETGEQGTAVHVTLPAASREEASDDEAHTHSR